MDFRCKVKDVSSDDFYDRMGFRVHQVNTQMSVNDVASTLWLRREYHDHSGRNCMRQWSKVQPVCDHRWDPGYNTGDDTSRPDPSQGNKKKKQLNVHNFIFFSSQAFCTITKKRLGIAWQWTLQVALCRGISPAKGDSPNMWSCRELCSQNEVPQPGWQGKDSILDSVFYFRPTKEKRRQKCRSRGETKGQSSESNTLWSWPRLYDWEHALGLK